MSRFNKISRGIRQGCPISALLFILCGEILSENIRKNERIKGIKIGKEAIKNVQLADDTTLFIENEESLKEALSLLEIFGTYSGLQLNKEKTEIIWIGSNKNNQKKPCNIKFKTTPVKH